MVKENLITFIEKNTGGKFLIIPPKTFHISNIIAFLISIPQIAGKNACIITDHPDKIDSMLSNNLPGDFYVSYSNVKNSDVINNLLTDNSLIFFDNINSYQQHHLDKFFEHTKVKLIGVIESIKNIKDWIIFSMNILDKGPILNYKLECINTEGKDIFNFKTLINFALSHIHNKHLIYTNHKKPDYIPDNITIIDTVGTIGSNSNIEFVHILGTISKHDFDHIIDKVYKRSLYNQNIPMVTVIFYIDTTESSQVENYTMICDHIEQQENNYHKNIDNSILIKYDNSIGIYVNVTA